jgi:hypothetical protein
LEVLSGEHLVSTPASSSILAHIVMMFFSPPSLNQPREKGNMRFHMLQNAQMALDFLRYKKIKLVNIRAEDIVDGNPKLTLGLIWTIILHFQVSEPNIIRATIIEIRLKIGIYIVRFENKILFITQSIFHP